MILATYELSDAATLATNSAQTDAPITNLQKMQPTRMWVTTQTTNPRVDITLAGNTSINLIALLFSNMTNGALVSIAGSTVSLGGTDVINEAVFAWGGSGSSRWAGYKRMHWFRFYDPGDERTVRYLRITIADGGNPDGVVRVGRLCVASAFQPARNFWYGGDILDIEDNTERDVTEGGQIVVTPLGPEPVTGTSIPMVFSSETEMRNSVGKLFRFQSGRKDVLLILDPDNTDFLPQQIFPGLLALKNTVVARAFSLFQTELSVRSLI